MIVALPGLFSYLSFTILTEGLDFVPKIKTLEVTNFIFANKIAM